MFLSSKIPSKCPHPNFFCIIYDFFKLSFNDFRENYGEKSKPSGRMSYRTRRRILSLSFFYYFKDFQEFWLCSKCPHPNFFCIIYDFFKLSFNDFRENYGEKSKPSGRMSYRTRRRILSLSFFYYFKDFQEFWLCSKCPHPNFFCIIYDFFKLSFNDFRENYGEKSKPSGRMSYRTRRRILSLSFFYYFKDFQEFWLCHVFWATSTLICYLYI